MIFHNFGKVVDRVRWNRQPNEEHMKFFVGLHQPCDAKHFDRSFLSINRLRGRIKPLKIKDWIMDSGAFTEIASYGRYRNSVDEYLFHINRYKDQGNLLAAVTQDWMCEPWIVAKTGKTVLEHQKLTILRYKTISRRSEVYILPVLQGYVIQDYLDHVCQYGDLLTPGQWVGVGSVCKRNEDVSQIEDILFAIKSLRPDLRLHGFGLKTTALNSKAVTDMLHTADSMAWSFSARKGGRNQNCWREAKAFEERINNNINT